jgi:outer membrane lipoprotein-sorting protein
MRYLLLSLVLVLSGCTEEQSRAIGQQPKKTVDRVTSDVNKAMQQGSERLKEDQK